MYINMYIQFSHNCLVTATFCVCDLVSGIRGLSHVGIYQQSHTEITNERSQLWWDWKVELFTFPVSSGNNTRDLRHSPLHLDVYQHQQKTKESTCNWMSAVLLFDGRDGRPAVSTYQIRSHLAKQDIQMRKGQQSIRFMETLLTLTASCLRQ